MGRCDYCDAPNAVNKIVDDDQASGAAMLCNVCYAGVGGVFIEMTERRQLEIVARMIADADSGYRGFAEKQHTDAAKKIIHFVTNNTVRP